MGTFIGLDYNPRTAKKLAGFGHLPKTLPTHQPVQLLPVVIDKPWGAEIWYTGIEARGESRVRTPSGELPLSGYLAQAPDALCADQPIVLLKILAPKAEENQGDLYFEVHEEKREVYVVTRVDEQAWPEGVGAIRFGMNQTVRATYADDDGFRADFLAAVQAYEHIRRALDGQDDSRLTDEVAERRAREAMNAFTQMRSLIVGDVVRVPPGLPHSLQHGVRVVEFQTPTYERQIISFGQRVLTQNHWDSAAAVASMRLDAPPISGNKDGLPNQTANQGADGSERIVEFDHFNALRIGLDAKQSFALRSPIPYAVCICIAGRLQIGDLVLGAEDAAFIPNAGLPIDLTNPTAQPALCLVAAPDL